LGDYHQARGIDERGRAASFDDGAFIASCIALGKQYDLQRRVRSEESVSKVLFGTALRLARNRGVVDGPATATLNGPVLEQRRRAFAEEIRTAVRRVDAIDALAASRRAGLIE